MTTRGFVTAIPDFPLVGFRHPARCPNTRELRCPTTASERLPGSPIDLLPSSPPRQSWVIQRLWSRLADQASPSRYGPTYGTNTLCQPVHWTYRRQGEISEVRPP